jgi:hypothetical protein
MKTSFIAIILPIVLSPLYAEEVPPVPARTPAAVTRSEARKESKMEKKVLVVAELKDIRFNLGGTISFHHPSTGTTYTWVAPSGEGREVILATLLAELRRAESLELNVYSLKADGSGPEFRVKGMTLLYDKLK